MQIIKQFMPVIIVFALLLFGGFVFISNSSSKTTQEASEQRSATAQVDAIDDSVVLTVGNKEAPATIVEYFDYKCPSCSNFHFTTGKEIENTYVNTDQLKYEVRITPIIGPDSANAARGAYCANAQNLFEEYHETVIQFMRDDYYGVGNIAAEYDNILTTNKLSEVTSGLDLDQATFKSCVDSDKYNSNLDNNLLAAADDEIRGTPGFAIGNQSFVGGQPFSVFKTLIDIELR